MEPLNKAFQSTFKVIFGECNLELDDLRDYLLKYHYGLNRQKSAVSGKEVNLASARYLDGAKFISQDEVDFSREFAPLDINEIKDVDSIMEAIEDRAYYTGNKVFGNSKFIENSDTIVDSFHIGDSHSVSESKYVGYSAYLRANCEYVFGLSHSKVAKYVIHGSIVIDSARCFETYCSDNCSDMFFAYNCQGCSHTMFSFNLRSKRNCIGNVELPRDKYMELRKKLVGESREYLEKRKTFYSIYDYSGTPDLREIKTRPKVAEESGNMAPIEAAFRSTSKVIFGKELGPLDDYGNYLNRGLEPVRKVRTALGNDIYYSHVALCYEYAPKNRIINTEEARELGKLAIDLKDGEDLAGTIGKLGKIAFYRGDHIEGENHNVIETHWTLDSVNAYKARAPAQTKNCAFSTMALSSESMFGCYRIVKSRFCIHCYDSIDLSRCFEVSDSNNCSDCYFCHNCENLTDCMFCFNTKSKRYAIGNVEVGREAYMKIKKMMLNEITRKLEKDKYLAASIYNVGCKGKNNG